MVGISVSRFGPRPGGLGAPTPLPGFWGSPPPPRGWGYEWDLCHIDTSDARSVLPSAPNHTSPGVGVMISITSSTGNP